MNQPDLSQPQTQPAPRPLTPVARAALFAGGSICLGLAIVGVFVPGLPTTVLLLVAAWCYLRSSNRAYRWMMTRPWLQGPLARMEEFQRRRALPLSIKFTALGFAWGSVALTWLAPVGNWALTFVVFMALACTAAMLLIKTYRADLPSE